MRLSMLIVLAFTVVLGVLSQAPVEAKGLGAGVGSSSVAYAQDQPSAKLDVDINVNKVEAGASGTRIRCGSLLAGSPSSFSLL